VLARTAEAPEAFDGVWLTAPLEAAEYARMLYANLRELDDAKADAILVECVPDDAAWAAIRDRLTRATPGVDDDCD
jgi:L-threonylcarbamoyladenylate synthase